MLKIQVCKGLSQKHQRQISRAGDSPTPSKANDAEASHGGHQLLHLGFLGIPKSVMQVYMQNQVLIFFWGVHPTSTIRTNHEVWFFFAPLWWPVILKHLQLTTLIFFFWTMLRASLQLWQSLNLQLTTLRNFRSEIPQNLVSNTMGTMCPALHEMVTGIQPELKPKNDFWWML